MDPGTVQGLTDEAIWAMHRCRDASASWERPAFQRRLDDLALPEVVA